MTIFPHTNLEALAKKFIKDILAKENFNGASVSKGGFLSGGNVIVCEHRGLQEYLQKTCVDECGIWTALPFKPLAGLLMQCAYNLSPKDQKKDESENFFNQSNLIWAIFKSPIVAAKLNLGKQDEKAFSVASEIASLFSAYQIYRPEIIEKWNNGEAYTAKNADENFKANEKLQRDIWLGLKKEFGSEPEADITQLYNLLKSELKNSKKSLPKQIFIFAPLSIPPIQLEALNLLSEAGCKVSLYLFQISKEYIGANLSDKQIAKLRKSSWENNKITDENDLYWDLGNRLIANLGRASQTFHEQLLALNLEYSESEPESGSNRETLLSKIQENIISDDNGGICEKDDSLTFSSCFSPLREIEVLHDYLLNLFAENLELTPEDIAIVAPNIENYASAIETVFGLNYILPYKVADRDVKKHDKSTQLLNMLFSLIGTRYEAPDIVALFEYSMYVQGKELNSSSRERLEKWIRENAIRHGLEVYAEKPNYSFKSGFEQLAAGFFMISETEFSEKWEYCYPDIEGSSAKNLGDFARFVEALQNFDKASEKYASIENWDAFLKENFQVFLGSDENSFSEDNPYQKIINAWDSLKKEMLIGLGKNAYKPIIHFAVLKIALLRKLEANAKSSYSMSGAISCSNLETLRATPHKVTCCIGMNSKEFPRQIMAKEISLMQEYKLGDKDTANEDRLIFLETIRSTKEKLYISWVGQNEKTAEELDPSSAVIMLLNYLKKQYGIEEKHLITKHPLQPFSKKYYNGNLETYDNRWNAELLQAPFIPISDFYKSVWAWEITNSQIDEQKTIDVLFKALSDAPKYFLKTVCGIELPEDIELLENSEPFVISGALDKWKLADLILKDDTHEKYMKEVKISKLKGSLPSGKFADRIINGIVKEAGELKAKAAGEKEGTYWIYPSKDKGKYRLRHWLYHLNLNLYENHNTKMFLKDATIELQGMSKERAEEILDDLWELKQKLDKRMLPIFPDAAWIYLTEKKDDRKVSNAQANIFGDGFNEGIAKYSQYAKKVIGKAEYFEELKIGLEKEFIECSENLFKGYAS